MCHLFLQIAKLYIQAKTQDAPANSKSTRAQPSYYGDINEPQVGVNAMTQFDPYLSALGLVSGSAWPMSAMSNAPAPANMEAYPQAQDMGSFLNSEAAGANFGVPGGGYNSVQDWFSGSRYLMNLMEAGDDLQMPDLDL